MVSRLSATVSLVAFGGIILAGCTQVTPHPGRVTFQQYCATCHGADASGNGPLAGDLPIAPANLRYLRESNDGVFPTEHVMTTVYGYPGKDTFSTMPEFGPLLDGPKQIWVSAEGEEVMTPVALLDLVSYLETLQE